MSTIKSCIDKSPGEHRLIEAADHALRENPHNAPMRGLAGEPALRRTRMAFFTSKRWQPGRTLRVRFLGGDPVVQGKIVNVAQTWSEFANLKLVFGTDPDAEIRIAFDMNDGSWSLIGTDAGLEDKHNATMNYGWLDQNTPDDEYERVVLHEFGHAIGCIHEHSSPVAGIPWDKEKTYAYYESTQGWSRADVDAQVFARYAETVTNHTKFDPDSIMEYPVPNELTVGDFFIGWNRELSPLDKEFVAKNYPKTAPTATVLTVDAPATSGSIGTAGETDLYQFTVGAVGRYLVETRGQTDTMLALYGVNSPTTLIAEDDDSGYGYNARVTAALLPGEYWARVRHYSSSGTGKYSIRVRRTS